MGERGDIIRTMQRAMNRQARELVVFQPGEDGINIIGRVVTKGLADELAATVHGSNVSWDIERQRSIAR